MGGTGGVVTAAGLVFAATMSSFIVSDLRVLGQIGTTIGLGLLFDTLIVRSFMTPSIATLLGRWFWWPLNVAPGRPVTCWTVWSPTAVRELLEREAAKPHDSDTQPIPVTGDDHERRSPLEVGER